MNELEIRTRDDKTGFLPGEEVSGEVRWRCSASPRTVELRLFWHTEGKGTRDVEVVETIGFHLPGAQDRRDFRFVLPDSPYSFSGKLVSVVWALELVLLPSNDTERLEITLSPTKSEITLHRSTTEAR